MIRWRWAMIWLVLWHLPLAGGERIPGWIQDGDTVGVIGDSITHGRKYHSYIHLYYTTRFPEVRFNLVNCGISGDTAAGALRRFDWDVGRHRPTVAMIMLGMNDVGRWLYGSDKTDPATRAAQRQQIDTYLENLAALSSRLQALGTRMIYLTPSIYEQEAALDTPNLRGVNDGLGLCADGVKALAAKSGAPVADIHAVMNRVNREQQQRDPAFTLVGPDRVHPGDPGQFVMAYAFLTAQGMPALVAKVAVDAAQGAVLAAENCAISDLTVRPDGIGFTCWARALPFPVEEAARPALAWIPFMAELNQEQLVVTGLAAGVHELRIDDEPVAAFTAAALAVGINLAEFSATPQYRQALAVKQLNDTRHWLHAGRLRSFALVRHWHMKDVTFDPEDFVQAKVFLEARLADPKVSEFDRKHIGIYLEHWPQEEQIRRDVAATTDRMYEMAKPVSRRYAIVRRAAGGNGGEMTGGTAR